MKTAFVFSGQGSQYVGMGQGVILDHPVAQATWVEADEALGFALSALVNEGPEPRLTLTENAQPAILAYSIALFRVLQAERPEWVPAMAAGHSLGEYSALVATGSLSFGEALRLVRLRGQAMQAAVAPGLGGMLAVIGLSVDILETLCAETGAEAGEPAIAIAAFNSPVQSVVAGALGDLERFAETAQQAGARHCIPLNVSAPFHTPALAGAGERLQEALAAIELKVPALPVFQNVDACAHQKPAEIIANLVLQVSAPVRWVDCVAAMHAAGAEEFVEIGPGRGLTGLIKKWNRKVPVRFTDRSRFWEQF
jgi:[acyl-carrier-protein] S-malonyltransferase